jgi:hypothetical protein
MTDRLRIVVAVAGAALAACSDGKGIPKEQYNDLLSKLDECKSQLERQKTAAEMCTKQLDEALAGAGKDDAWVVRVEGETVSLVARPRRPGGTGGGGDVRDEIAVAVSGAFEGQVRGSKQGIQQCYVSALKKNESLQNREIKLMVSVTANPTGKLTNPSFSPSVSPDFTSCLTKIASNWKVQAYQGGSFTLQYPVTLRPTE